jgi:hypothetical protein
MFPARLRARIDSLFSFPVGLLHVFMTRGVRVALVKVLSGALRVADHTLGTAGDLRIRWVMLEGMLPPRMAARLSSDNRA